MKRFTSACLALVSAGIAVAQLRAARPQYGGTLRMSTAGVIRSSNPSAQPADAADAAIRGRVLPLVFETLTRVDADAGLQPLLATSWSRDARAQRWTFRLRPAVILHDGATLEPWQVAASIRAVESRWRVTTDGDALIVEPSEPVDDLPWRLADVSHAIAIRSGDQLLGTGPFRIDRLDATSLTLRAHDAHHDGRPFLDAVDVQMGRALGAQLADLESGRADIANVQATDVRRIVQRGMRLVSTKPSELVAIVFEPHRTADAFAPVRRSLAGAIDRRTMSAVLLQQQASPAFGVLPAWISGYTIPEPDRRQVLTRSAIGALTVDQRELALRVDASDAAAQAIAERIAVDAREAGFSIKVQAPTGLAPRADARLIRARILPTSPERALSDAFAKLRPRGADRPADTAPIASLDDVLRAEAAFVDRNVVIPVVHLPDLYAAADRVSSWQSKPVLGTGVWNLADVWIRAAQPGQPGQR
jgi:peptide/nickel transport system substrate-binding protein